MSNKFYTQDWNFEFKKNTNGISNLELCIEIGCFEGLTSNYIVENILSKSGKLICIDPLTDMYLNDNLDTKDIEGNSSDFSYFAGQYDRFLNNVNDHLNDGKIRLIRELSSNVFKSLRKEYDNLVDFIYVDGDHRPESVYIDAINSIELCKPNGFILFDDYTWGETKTGIDKFIQEYSNRLEIIVKDYQVLIKKII